MWEISLTEKSPWKKVLKRVMKANESDIANENREKQTASQTNFIQIVPCKLNYKTTRPWTHSSSSYVKMFDFAIFYPIIFRIFTLNLHTEFSFCSYTGIIINVVYLNFQALRLLKILHIRRFDLQATKCSKHRIILRHWKIQKSLLKRL